MITLYLIKHPFVIKISEEDKKLKEVLSAHHFWIYFLSFCRKFSYTYTYTLKSAQKVFWTGKSKSAPFWTAEIFEVCRNFLYTFQEAYCLYFYALSKILQISSQH